MRVIFSGCGTQVTRAVWGLHEHLEIRGIRQLVPHQTWFGKSCQVSAAHPEGDLTTEPPLRTFGMPTTSTIENRSHAQPGAGHHFGRRYDRAAYAGGNG